MGSPDQERLDAMSDALAGMVKRQRELEARIAFLEFTSGFKTPALPVQERVLTPPPLASPSATPPPQALSRHQPPPLPTVAPTVPPPFVQPIAQAQPQVDPQSKTQLETQVGLTWINRIAVITLIFGAAFGFKYAVDSGYIGPALRVALGIASAIAFLFFGDRMWRRGHAIFAQGLMGLGISLLYLSFYASFSLYFLLPQTAAFALMAMTTVAAGFLGVQYSSQAIALLGLLGGYLTPILLSTGDDHPWVLFSYTFVVNLGGLALTRTRQWRLTEYLSAIATVCIYAGWYASWFSDSNRLVAGVFALAFYAQFATAVARPIAFTAQFLSAMASMAVATTSPQLLVMSLIYAAGGLAVSEFRRWQETPPWSLFCFWLPYGMWLSNSSRAIERGVTFELFSLGFAIFFLWTIRWAGVCKRSLRETDLAMFVANAAAYFVASYQLLNPVQHGLMGYFAVALALLYGSAAKLLSKPEDGEPSSSPPSVLAMAVALSFLTLAIPIQFAGFRITIAWALQGSVLAWLAARYKNVRLNAASWLVFGLVLARLFAFDAWIPSGSFGLRFLTFAVSAAGLWLAARFARPDLLAIAPYVAGHFVMLWGLGMEVVTWVERTTTIDTINVETMSISILMALYALMLVILGVATRTVINRVLGLGLMGIVVSKLYLSDIWQLSRILRITAFLALGMLLLLVSYLYSRFKPVIARFWKDDQIVER